MKKFVVLLVVVAMTCISGLAFAASEVSVSGEMAIRSRDFMNLDLNDKVPDGTADTQSRVRLDVNAKAGDVKGKISIWNDFDTWGRFEAPQANAATTGSGNPGFLSLREAWINFNLPVIPVNVNAGHQLLSLGQGWFFRSMHYGSDAWVAANVAGNNTAAIVDVKIAEVNPAASDDIDAYVLLDVFKLNDKMTAGIDITNLKDRKATLSTSGGIYGGTNPYKEINIQNVGLNFTGVLGPVNLKAEIDVQGGKASTVTAGGTDTKFKGNQIVVQGSVPLDPVTINFTVARGSGNKLNSTSPDVNQYVNALDIDPHYTFLYEYKIGNKGANNYLNGKAGDVHTGFANTTALNVGATFAVAKTLTIGADIWMLQSTEKVANKVGTGTTNDLGQEIDVKINWALAENLSWNWTLGMFNPGDGMGKDSATGIQGILSFKF